MSQKAHWISQLKRNVDAIFACTATSKELATDSLDNQYNFKNDMWLYTITVHWGFVFKLIWYDWSLFMLTNNLMQQ